MASADDGAANYYDCGVSRDDANENSDSQSLSDFEDSSDILSRGTDFDETSIQPSTRIESFIIMILSIAAFLSLVGVLISYTIQSPPPLNISHHWGQYSPYFPVPSTISPKTPRECSITFAQLLSRHGARYPTAPRGAAYNATIRSIHTSATSYLDAFAFLESYEYGLGADELTPFGERELYDSGTDFFARYSALVESSSSAPFIRASGGSRVVVSAEKFALGYNAAQPFSSNENSIINVIISESLGSNNTLNHGLCTAFESSPYYSTIGSSAQETFAATFFPAIMSRISAHLPGTNLSTDEIITLMDLCPFETVAGASTTDGLQLSPFCPLFTPTEWVSYSYYQSLGKYYGSSSGNPLGPTQGVGWTNELIARLTSQPVVDHTSSNSSLDSNKSTFPLHQTLYADFTHDNDMSSIFAALGLYNATPPLSNTSAQTTAQTKGYSAAWTVPFGARMAVEKMRCGGSEEEELVRVLVNNRVVPLQGCGADELGRCTVGAFVESLGFAREGGMWERCFD